MKADRNEPIDMDILQTFPKNELGEISQHIIKYTSVCTEPKKLFTLNAKS